MRVALLMFVVACGSTQKPAPDPAPVPPGPAQDTRTPFEKRRDTGCEAAGDRLVTCAVADAKADLDAGKVNKAEYDKNTAPEIRHELKKQWLKTCHEIGNSFQVRVLEVCVKEEEQCGPFVDCLGHLNDKPK